MTIDIIRGPYVEDIRQQPDVLRQLIARLETDSAYAEVARWLQQEDGDTFVLTGMGSSCHGLYPLHRALCTAGRNSCHLETSELLEGFEGAYRKSATLIAVSQSGESIEIVKLMQRAAAFGRTLAVTNNASSSLARLAHQALLIHSGPEATVSCKSYLNTLAGLRWLEAVLLGATPASALAELRQAERVVRDYLLAWESHVEAAARLLTGVRSVFVVGRGRSLAAAGTGGLTLKESTRHHAEGMSAAAFRHGPLEMVGSDNFVLAFDGEGETAALNRKLVGDVARVGGRAASVSADATEDFLRIPAVPPAVRPIVEMLPIQMISLALAVLDGREAGRFERASKITTVA